MFLDKRCESEIIEKIGVDYIKLFHVSSLS